MKRAIKSVSPEAMTLVQVSHDRNIKNRIMTHEKLMHIIREYSYLLPIDGISYMKKMQSCVKNKY